METVEAERYGWRHGAPAGLKVDGGNPLQPERIRSISEASRGFEGYKSTRCIIESNACAARNRSRNGIHSGLSHRSI